MQPPGRSGNLRTTRLPVSYQYVCPAEPEGLALRDAGLRLPQHGWAMSRGNGGGQGSSYHSQKHNQYRPVPVSADVFRAGDYYSSAVDTAGEPFPMEAVYVKHLSEDARARRCRSDSDLLVTKPMRPFPPGRVARKKVSFASTQVAGISAEEDNSRRKLNDQAAVLPQFKKHNWKQHDDLPQEKKISSSNGQSDGDASSNCVGGGGEGGPPEDADEVLREQKEVFNLLLKADECHEEWLATERMRQERDGNSSCRPPGYDSPKKGSGGIGPCFLPAGIIDHQKKAGNKQGQKSGSSTASDHWKLQGNPQHTGASYSPLNQELSLSRDHCGKIMETPGPSGYQSIMKLPSADYCLYPVRTTALAVDLWVPQHGNRDCHGGGGKRSSSKHRQERKQDNNRPATNFTDVFTAGAYYSHTMHTAGGPVASGTVYWQNRNGVHRFSDREPLAVGSDRSFAPGRKISFASSGQVAVSSTDEDDSSSEPSHKAAVYGEQNMPPSRQVTEQHYWGQRDDLPQDEELLCSNERSGGDEPPDFLGGGMERGLLEDVDEVLKEQELFARLLKADERHEEQLALKCVVQEQDPTTCLRPAGEDSLTKGTRNGGGSCYASSAAIDHDKKAGKNERKNESGNNAVNGRRKPKARMRRLNREQSLIEGHSGRGMQPSLGCGGKWTIKLPSSQYYALSAGPKARAVGEAELREPPRHGNTVCCGGGQKRAFWHQRQQCRQQQNRPASAYVDVCMAGAYYDPIPMHTARWPLASGTVYWQNANEDAVVFPVSSATQPAAIREARSLAPGRVTLPMLPFASARQAANMWAYQDNGSREFSE